MLSEARAREREREEIPGHRMIYTRDLYDPVSANRSEIDPAMALLVYSQYWDEIIYGR